MYSHKKGDDYGHGKADQYGDKDDKNYAWGRVARMVTEEVDWENFQESSLFPGTIIHE